MKVSVLAGLGDYYDSQATGYDGLPFIYQNLVDLSEKLITNNWKTFPPMIDQAASKEGILDKLKEALGMCDAATETFLFYYTGHGDKKVNYSGQLPQNDVYCVTYNPRLKYNYTPPVNSFLSEFDYEEFISRFHSKLPNAHLITILDCCFSGGVVPDIKSQQNFHTLFASSSEAENAYYDSNSVFFKALAESWDGDTIESIAMDVSENISSVRGAQECFIRVSPKFKNKPLF